MTLLGYSVFADVRALNRTTGALQRRDMDLQRHGHTARAPGGNEGRDRRGAPTSRGPRDC